MKDKKEVAAQFKEMQILPTFTAISHEDKLNINRARLSLYSLLIPIHDRKVAMNEFYGLAEEWHKRMKWPQSAFFKDEFEKLYPLQERNTECIYLYTLQEFFFQFLNQGLRKLRHPL